ncbi:hypothetical protein SEA_LEONARD_73 [Gordonia phage Leonard]|uniref:Helix-turn-helix DNA binding domain protein n=1 Tax=Gordonia phage Leonard TaxID=2656539 RepID=A0A649VMY0_9CAUD|nr:hypothetical protein BI045_gp73 [Gordonia phage Phinally]YP_010002292.1 hypothetical protein J1769_gp73 [Gordonia phage Leonard]AMS03065.1 hypothetical protein SEA_PHINALLY_73 [Gordonia phage Phinally]QGJ93435.1 hypothetical protein SEA_LEONARD_73 [Gordonia phage Leonard]
MPRGDRYEVTTLPDGWTPDTLDPLEREEFDHLVGYGISYEDAIRRLNLGSIATIGRRAHRRNTE